MMLEGKGGTNAMSNTKLFIIIVAFVVVQLLLNTSRNMMTSSALLPVVDKRASEEHPAATHTDDVSTTFGKAMTERLDWKTYESSIETDDKVALKSFEREVFMLATSFATMEPKTPINATCQAPALVVPQQHYVVPQEQDNASAQDSSTSSFCSPVTSSVFTGRIRSTPRRVAHAVQLGFDIDTLEILLHELIDVIDKFFIVEWTMPHNQNMSPKPLAWEAVKGQARFAFACDKIVHIVMDDVDAAYVTPGSMWSVESLQEKRRFELIMEWNEQTKFFAADDLIGFGDTDEIPSRTNVHMLKHCEWQNNEPVDVGIWFPFGRIHQAFQTDFPISGHPYTLGDPTYYIWGSTTNYASRNRGGSRNWILGGAHFTHYGFLVYQVLKHMSCSECDTHLLVLSKLHAAVKTGKWKELEQEMSQLPSEFVARTIPLEKLDPDEREKIVYLPWFYDCNRNRYSMWEGHPDSRIQLTEDEAENKVKNHSIEEEEGGHGRLLRSDSFHTEPTWELD